jgi:protein gp37
MAETTIEWTDATWNPVAGCTVLTAGCTNCYAMRMAARLEAMGAPKYAGLTRRSGDRRVWTGAVSLDEAAIGAPFAWKKPRLIFVNSMSDLFQDAVPESFIERVWRTMAATPRHAYQILTKRPDRMARVSASLPRLPNVWLGTSVEPASPSSSSNGAAETRRPRAACLASGRSTRCLSIFLEDVRDPFCDQSMGDTTRICGRTTQREELRAAGR